MKAIQTTGMQLLALVRASLWQQRADEVFFTSKQVDWKEIGQLALLQTVGPLAFEASLKLPPHLQPPQEWKKKALSFLEANRRTHVLVDKSATEAIEGLKAEGIHAVMLKGQAYARKYPKPELRQCGDIDIYVGGSNYRDAYMASVDLGWKSHEDFMPDAKHYGCELHGVKIELHRTAGILVSSSANRAFQEWSDTQLSSSGESVLIDCRQIPVPTPVFDVVFVFLHLYHHFLNGGIGLRQVCDWTLLLHCHSREMDLRELEKRLEDFGLLRAWKRFTPIAVECLGLPASECPFYSPQYHRDAERILRHILKEGNFGRGARKSSPRPKGYLAGKMHSFRRHSSALINKFRIDPKAISLSYLNFIYKGIARILNDRMGKKRRT